MSGALGEHADEEITLRDLEIVSSEANGVLYSAFDFETGEFVLPGGGDLTVAGCDIRTFQAPTPGPVDKVFWLD